MKISNRNIPILVALLMTALLSIQGVACAQNDPPTDLPAEEVYQPGGAAVPEETLSPGESQKDAYEQTQEKWSQRITSTASYMDTFFDDRRL